ncbi:protein arginine kinase [candidate division WOR-3 bacterium]|nr:protein arginine kinase [candidate division WOR-3 bacterium]
MEFKDLISFSPSWTNAQGEFAEIVFSSRVRLARNLAQFKFPLKAKKEELKEIFNLVKNCMASIPGEKLVFPLLSLRPLDKEFLVERHFISRQFFKNRDGKGIGIWKEENLAIIINEEDHLRIQALTAGLSLTKAHKLANRLDNDISKKLPYAFSSQFGYLTSCPTNTGTGLRTSVLIHLPGLVHSGKIRKVIERLGQVGFSVRGFYGEGQEVEGNFFQISNQTTLGRKEEEIVDGLHKTVIQVVEYETRARELLLKNAEIQLEDKIWRAYAILKSARLLSTKEFINLSSAVRLGVGLGILKKVSLKTLNELLIFTQPAHLQKITGHPMEPAERDTRRASYVRQKL